MKRGMSPPVELAALAFRDAILARALCGRGEKRRED
jgi:hypothetical protein